jgi:crotonobetainyl-CoA:carnitine CoA-transferase CaiB-like acyl-CoA transferase
MSFFVESQKRGFPAGAVLSPDEAFADEHSRARGFPVAVDHPDLERTVLHPGVPYVFSASPAIAGSRAPKIGEHTAAVLAEWV